jgi:hypothetical protein
MARKRIPAAERARAYYQKTTKEECWPWMGARDGKGYGRIRDDQSNLASATRIIWEGEKGPIPPGMNLLHRCDNPPCVNLEHLFLGSAQANTIDMHMKGRGRSKLTPEVVRAIRAEYASGGIKQAEIAQRYGVKEACIQRLVAGRTWKHVA